MNNFLELDAIAVSQPFQEFYVCAIKAKTLFDIVFTDPIRYDKNGNLIGVQRTLDEQKRVKEIKEFVEGVDAAFPNSIVLAANWDVNGLNCESDEERWRFDPKTRKLIIPKEKKLASIIDGQHRIYGFKDANDTAKEIELLCSVYIDLPNPSQAYLFATINSTQKRVDKSLAYEQFGYNIDFEKPISWSPDKLAIALYKKFNSEPGPFYRHIKMASQVDEVLTSEIKKSGWAVSTATIVDGILRLITTNPKRDKYLLQQITVKERDRKLLDPESFPFLRIDKSPLRKLYLNTEDFVIYKIVSNFFEAAFGVLSANDRAFVITKTIGVQGLFDALKKVLEVDILRENGVIENVDFRKEYYINMFEKIKHINFGTDFYAQFSNVGRSQIADTFLLANDYITLPSKEEMSPKDKIRFDYLSKIKRIIENTD